MAVEDQMIPLVGISEQAVITCLDTLLVSYSKLLACDGVKVAES